MRRRRPATFLWTGIALAALIVLVVSGAVIISQSSRPANGGLAGNPDLDPGTRISGTAPNFTLVDQFGRRVSLRSFRGKVVVLDFNDSECTTICPLTTAAMIEAQAMLGRAASQLALLGVDANPTATAVRDVRTYSEDHGMMRRWHFLTGSLAQLKAVWKAYKIEVAIEQGQIDHTPATFVIDTRGRLTRLYLTQQAYAAVGQLAQLLAGEVSALLPGHPPLHSHVSYAQIPGLRPDMTVRAPGPSREPVVLGPGAAPRLYLFFATWDREVTNLAGQLDRLNAYAAAAARAGLPALTGIDEGSVEPSPRALPAFLSALPHPLAYPVAIDHSGRIADGYGVQDEPWLVLTSASGRILWYYDIATSGWLSRTSLERQIRNALARAPRGAEGGGATRELAGSPAPLAAVHEQADQLLGGESALAERIRALRGYPIVLNVWGSWCTGCKAEARDLARFAAAHPQAQVVGVDTQDTKGGAQAFYRRYGWHHPSIFDPHGDIASQLGLQGTPTTFFLDRQHKVVAEIIGATTLSGFDQGLARAEKA